MKKYIKIIHISFALSFFFSLSSISAQTRTTFTANIGYAATANDVKSTAVPRL